MADFGKLNSNIAQLKTDAEALINLQGTEDPTIQAGIDAAAQAVSDIDAEVKAKLPS